MSSFKTYITGAAAALTSTFVVATGASAQTALTNGVSLRTGAPPVANYNSIDLGSTPGTGMVTQMPLSLSYGGVDLNVSFAGGGGVAQSGRMWNPTPGSNFFVASGVGGSAAFSFGSAQRYFGFAWSSPDNLNNVQFYNGGSLLASISGDGFRSAGNIVNGNSTTYAGFSFSELQFDRVVMTGAPNAGFEFGGVTFSNTAPEVVPIPLGGVGGIVALLGMFALRRGLGGRLPQRLLAFASLAPRRQQVQRFA